MNPRVSALLTGTFPSECTHAIAGSTTDSLARPGTTSTSFITDAGLKKCNARVRRCGDTSLMTSATR